MMSFDPREFDGLIDAALAEDLGATGDITSALLPDDPPVSARFVARQAGIVAGGSLIERVSQRLAERGEESPAVVAQLIPDGAACGPGDAIATIRGARRHVLELERTALNFLTRLCGVATLTRRYVDEAARGSAACRVYDTRKTLPGWRALDKYAVLCGGGHNHRIGLFDAVLIKDNHIAGVPNERLAFALFEMLNRVGPGKPAFVEVEVDSLGQFAEVCKVIGVNIILLDNFSMEDMRAAVRMRDEAGLRGRIELEASGGVRLETIAAIAATGIDRIAVGAITHSAPGLDIGLDFE